MPETEHPTLPVDEARRKALYDRMRSDPDVRRQLEADRDGFMRLAREDPSIVEINRVFATAWVQGFGAARSTVVPVRESWSGRAKPHVRRWPRFKTGPSGRT